MLLLAQRRFRVLPLATIADEPEGILVEVFAPAAMEAAADDDVTGNSTVTIPLLVPLDEGHMRSARPGAKY